MVWTKKEITQADCDKLSEIRDLEVDQKTPIRVLHRRSQLVRPKMVYRVKATYVNPHFFELHLLAQAGTYIKELVHGDLGRTTPNIGSILETEADILQLDVTNVFESQDQAEAMPIEELFKVGIDMTTSLIYEPKEKPKVLRY
jgi:tRNA pseudouridine synthase 10